MTRDLRVAAFRPDDERMAEAVELIESLGATPVADPMLAVDPTGAVPRTDADFTILTSKTGAELAGEAGWQPTDTTLCAIGDPTADALEAEGYSVDLIPEAFSSTGLVDTLEGKCGGARVEVARSDHGSDVLTDGLNAAGAFVHETILYRLTRPDGAGESAALAAEGDLDAALFTSSLTVENFLDAAAERNVREGAIAGLNDPDTVVGVIGEPTRETAEGLGIGVDVVPDRADFSELARTAIETARSDHDR
ncbi:uroporphyrinogen-III synthase [Halorientalis salina]|uniref:uroporphyrinogen-III synthase n=1 Tax=Halorientalis salina TaxID=2932266 RepID=UPI0010ACCE2E|nr:uroporphyrinogen-III synthase [Halorientalis salina]